MTTYARYNFTAPNGKASLFNWDGWENNQSKVEADLMFARLRMSLPESEAFALDSVELINEQDLPAYVVSVWADGFGNWHGKATFTTPLGNTGEAERVLDNAKRAIRRAIRSELQHRQPASHTLPALRYTVTNCRQIASTNQTTSITLSEQGCR